MDEYSCKRAHGLGFGRRTSSLTLRDTKHDTRSTQSCNRLGCSTRYNSMKGTEISNTEKLKMSRTALRSTSKAAAGSSSKPFSSATSLRKSKEKKDPTSAPEAATAGNSRRLKHKDKLENDIEHDETLTLDSVPTDTGNQVVSSDPESLDSENLDGFTTDASGESGSSNASAQLQARKQISRQTGTDNQASSSGSSIRRAIASRNATQTIRSSLGQGADAQRNGIRNLTCTSISDVLSFGSSSSDSMLNRTNASRKYLDGDNSTSRGKGRMGSLSGGSSSSSRAIHVPSPSIINRSLPQPTSQRTRSHPISRDGSISARTQRNADVESRIRLSGHGDNIFSLSEPLMTSQVPQAQYSVSETALTRQPRSFHTEASTRASSSSNSTGRSRQVAHLDDSSRMFHSSFADRDSYRPVNMDGIAEVLLALERIEQDEELTYEQLLVLETNLFLGGLGFHDQHRDMRLDIDSMSYEELLALGEKMGTVSTALTEEELSKCLQRSIYVHPSTVSGITTYGEDVKCSVCQEEYAAGDEVGKLGCQHLYHVVCIHQWLRQKNWCPICKASASPS